jgi:hypothetical protein
MEHTTFAVGDFALQKGGAVIEDAKLRHVRVGELDETTDKALPASPLGLHRAHHPDQPHGRSRRAGRDRPQQSPMAALPVGRRWSQFSLTGGR